MPHHELHDAVQESLPDGRESLSVLTDELTRRINAALYGGPAPSERATQSRHDWEVRMETTLKTWEGDPDLVADEEEGLIAPSPATLSLAKSTASALCASGAPAPDRIVPDADGGIVLKWRNDDTMVTVEILESLSLNFVHYNDCRVVESLTTPLANAVQ